MNRPADDLPLPSLDALLAGTFTLMTGWADPVPSRHATPARQRLLMARKIVANLFFLKAHPHASPALRQVMANLHARWVPLCNKAGDGQGTATEADLHALLPLGSASLLH
jgi:hypothetical protein